MKLKAIVALLLSAVPVWAAPPEAPTDVTAAKGELTEVVVKVPTGKTLCYKLVGAEAAFREMKGSADTEKVFWLFSKTGGQSFVVWWFQGDADSSVTNVNKGAAPTPPPGPGPGPVPPPTPINATWAIVVEETSARTPAISAVLNDLAMWNRVAAKGVKWRTYDKDSADTKAKKYDVAAAPVGYPALLLLDSVGKVLKVSKLPATSVETEAAITGGK